MSRSAPFDYMPRGVIKIDVNNMDHQKIVIERNKQFDKVIKEGLDIDFVHVTISTNAKVECFKCGTLAESSNEFNYDSYRSDYNIDNQLTELKCPCCKTTYSYNSRTGKFNVIQEKPTALKAKQHDTA